MLLLILITSLLASSSINAQTFDALWRDMQAIYIPMARDFESADCQKYIHPHWNNARKALGHALLNGPDPNLLRHKTIFENMLRLGRNVIQNFEVQYLKSCITDENRKLLTPIIDTNFSGIPLEIGEFNWSSNTLGQVFHLIRCLEMVDIKNIKTIVEFGGGFGALARVTKQVIPDVTYIIIDLPELLAVQYVYLKSTLTNLSVEMHHEIPAEFSLGTVHLIPIHFIEKIRIVPDIFVSVFALSECPLFVQDLLVSINFFGSPSLYMVGQIAQWNEKYESENLVLNSIRKFYNHRLIQPYHLFDNSLWAYEAQAYN